MVTVSIEQPSIPFTYYIVCRYIYIKHRSMFDLSLVVVDVVVAVVVVVEVLSHAWFYVFMENLLFGVLKIILSHCRFGACVTNQYHHPRWNDFQWVLRTWMRFIRRIEWNFIFWINEFYHQFMIEEEGSNFSNLKFEKLFQLSNIGEGWIFLAEMPKCKEKINEKIRTRTTLAECESYGFLFYEHQHHYANTKAQEFCWIIRITTKWKQQTKTLSQNWLRGNIFFLAIVTPLDDLTLEFHRTVSIDDSEEQQKKREEISQEKILRKDEQNES